MNGLAAVLALTGDAEHALEHLWLAVKVASEVGDKYELAHAHNTIGAVYHDQERPRAARDHWRQALDGYTLLGVPDADAVRHRLADNA